MHAVSLKTRNMFLKSSSKYQLNNVFGYICRVFKWKGKKMFYFLHINLTVLNFGKKLIHANVTSY